MCVCLTPQLDEVTGIIRLVVLLVSYAIKMKSNLLIYTGGISRGLIDWDNYNHTLLNHLINGIIIEAEVNDCATITNRKVRNTIDNQLIIPIITTK